MAKLLLFQLYGPLASWGDPAVGEYRPSATHPGKSHIAGLLGAALGRRREQEDELAALVHSYGLAVRIEAEGELLRDYHTIQVPPQRRGQRFRTRRDELSVAKPNTILSQRDYRMDAAWICALWASASAPYPLSDLAEALRRPHFTLYLGRKSCTPSLPLNPQLVECVSLKEAFAHYPVDPRLSGALTKSGPHRYCWEMPLPLDLETGFDRGEQLWEVPRNDLPRSRLRWQFGRRDEYHAIG
ncbi:type I-E CRISPR-associated protein Cas5/CasD [Acidithiobacillus caldus]|jgi:CRISPR system Cascade subunit CasD|uniref:Type I-E CRISPR-associated protein Cas5/CasD n=1 Tax=Acidithiobacillus caldus TaxID=33059 RepID=A0A1E7YMM2_9PROT|nr:type I-E CRISPR-associated protein Cas5/CasD [Acidithiobacillus caldus]MBU2789390.1 type I-E CRISPR-associated protein Cas5/CasD [Acidithiobacillus caldus]MBU2820316.1 type I-E CRISPR-associated protein Cas5/CasD [Acidithiobacillus caldus]OFC35074.1 type I-E CRISPR-associated protein Cas5/CasD [Acidithiobacillus caldus]OFC36296.1 type I-E CRISPR-associated protein Cas5/CasD [Acidithiobacillus caldus]OFC40588.1 type I-E CRISPR-associated protein Cas5/CasD [Acidithiobacillus caldus]